MGRWLIDDRIIYEIASKVRASCRVEEANLIKRERRPLKSQTIEIIKRYNAENESRLNEPVPLGATTDVLCEVKRQQEERDYKLRRNGAYGKIVQKRYWQSYARIIRVKARAMVKPRFLRV
jgi:hypothetical protein